MGGRHGHCCCERGGERHVVGLEEGLVVMQEPCACC